VLRIGVTDNSGELEVQGEFTATIAELETAHRGTLAEAFGPIVGY